MAFALVLFMTEELLLTGVAVMLAVSLTGVAVMLAVYGMLPLEGEWGVMTTFGDDVIFDDAVISRL